MPLVTAAAKSGMSERTARKYRRSGKVPSELKREHDWRTRPDPFEAVWPEVETLLERDAGLQAKTVFEELCRRYPGEFQSGQLRTLQRRFCRWRALKGAEREVYFAQAHRPGEQSQSDFTDMKSLGVVIGGEAFPHLLYHFVLTYSNWESVMVCGAETFESLSEGVQGALWRLGGVPEEHRTDNLSAATHELRNSRGRGFTERYRELLGHYGLRGSKNTPGRAHENGDIESSHGGFKNCVDQRLRLWGRREFETLPEYEGFLQSMVDERNAPREVKLREELTVLRVLPVRPLPAYREEEVRVSRWSTIRVVAKTYSVSSRLIGHKVQARLYATRLEVRYGGEVVHRFERLHGHGAHRIDYRHVIHSLVRKPGAFRRYVYREALFPSVVFRRAYDALVERSDKWADLEYVQILYLAATTLECVVEATLSEMLEVGEVPAYEAVKARVSPTPRSAPPSIELEPVELDVYDELLECEELGDE